MLISLPEGSVPLFLKNQTTSFGCAANQFECHSGGCISAAYICNGEYDCHDRSDELSSNCAKDEFICANMCSGNYLSCYLKSSEFRRSELPIF